MRKRLIIIGCVLMLLAGATFALGGLNDRFSGINLTSDNYMELPQIAAPAGNPINNTGWLYVKDSAGTTKLYFEDDAGLVTDLMASSATLWSNIGNPGANKTITFGTWTTTLTGAHVAADGFTIQNTGDFGDISILKVQQSAGNPTDGTVLEVISADTDADALLVTANSINSLVVAGSGNVDILGGTGTITYTDFTVSADGVISITPDLSPAACMTIAPSAAATTGLVVSSANLTNAIDVGAKTILGAAAVINFTAFDVSGAGAVTCASLDSGSGTIVTTGAVNGGSLTITGAANIGTWKQDAVIPASAAPTTITVNGAGAGGVTIGGTSTGAITLGGGATLVNLPAATDMTLSGGTITGTDTGTGPMLSLTNNTLTNSNLVTLSATAMTSGKGVSFTAAGVLTGDCFYAQATEGAGFTGNYFRGYDGTADDITIKRHGAITITGNASADMLTITAGDIQLTAGDIDLDNGQLMVDTTQDLASNISRNFAGAGGAALLTVAEQNAGSTNTALAVTNAGTAASTGLSVAHSGDNPTVALTAGAARTGDVINIDMANQLDQRALNITGAITSVAAGGVIEVHATGVIPATASLLRLDADTAQPGDGDGWMLNIDDDTLVVATPSKYAVLIDSNANEALHVATGKSLFDEVATFTSGIVATGDIDVDFSANTEEMNVTTAVTDYAAGTGVVTVFSSGAGATNNTHLLRLVNATNGDAQDHFILCQDNSNGAAANGDEMFAVGSGGAVRAAGGVAPGPTVTSALHSTTVTIANADIKTLRATPVTLVAAPGVGYYVELVSATLILNYSTAVFTESADNLVIQYNTSGLDATAAIETTGFIDQAADQVAHIKGDTIITATAANMANLALELFNTGDGEFGGGNDSTMNVVVTYWVHATGL